VFQLSAAARTIHIAAHTQKAFKDTSDMDPSMFRGSGDVTAFLTNGFGLCQVDKESNRIYFKCLFSRDLDDECEDFLMEGRPYIGDTGDFRLVGPAGSLRDEKAKAAEEAKGRLLPKLTPRQVEELRRLRDAGETPRDAASELRRARLDGNLKSKNSVAKAWKEMGPGPSSDQPSMDFGGGGHGREAEDVERPEAPF
jgi:hypothetical protein